MWHRPHHVGSEGLKEKVSMDSKRCLNDIQERSSPRTASLPGQFSRIKENSVLYSFWALRDDKTWAEGFLKPGKVAVTIVKAVSISKHPQGSCQQKAHIAAPHWQDHRSAECFSLWKSPPVTHGHSSAERTRLLLKARNQSVFFMPGGACLCLSSLTTALHKLTQSLSFPSLHPLLWPPQQKNPKKYPKHLETLGCLSCTEKLRSTYF